MKAIVQDVYGSAGVLELRDIDRPPIGEEEVLVRVRAAGVDPGMWHLMAGEPYLIRAMGFGLRAPKVKVRGRDVAGMVAAAGAGVTRFRAGDQVYGTCESGSFAEYAAARDKRLADLDLQATRQRSPREALPPADPSGRSGNRSPR